MSANVLRKRHKPQIEKLGINREKIAIFITALAELHNGRLMPTRLKVAALKDTLPGAALARTAGPYE